MTRASLVLVGLAFAACSRTSAPAVTPTPDPTPDPVAADPDPPTDAEPPPPELFHFAASTEPVPSWVQPAAERVIAPRLLAQTFEDAAIGGSIALVRTAADHLVVHREQGVIGTVDIDPHAAWIGLDGRDRIYVADADGQLERADSWQARFEPVGSVLHARAWDATTTSIVAVTRDQVLRSRDGGESFSPLPALPERVRPTAVFTRSDQAVVVQGIDAARTRAIYLLSPRARSWRRAPAEVGELSRMGGWIADGDEYDCRWVLSRDGKRWTEAAVEPEYADWSDLSDLGEEVLLRPRDPLPTLTEPQPPKASAKCPGGVDLWGGLGMGGGGGDEPIRGTAGPPPPLASHWVRLFSDSDCRRDPDDEYSCATGLAPTRLPHVLHWDEQTRRIHVSALPPSCHRPERIDAVAGIGMLRCTEPGAIHLWTIGPEHEWRDDGSIPFDAQPPGALTAAADGTLLLHGRCEGRRCASSWLRAPERRQAGHWTELADAEALAYRVLDGGRALRIGGDAKQGYALSIVDHAGQVEPVAARVQLGELSMSGARVADDRTLQLGFGDDEAPAWVISAQGRLEPIDASLPELAFTATRLRVHESFPRVAALGDYDGDGLHDFAVQNFTDPDHTRDLVVVRGWGGIGEMPIDGLTDPEHLRIALDVPLYSTNGLTGVGDINGDGHADLALATVHDGTSSRSLASEIYVVLGRSTSESRSLAAIREGEGGFWIGGIPEQRVGDLRLGPAGDVNGDGRDDLVLVFDARGSDYGVLHVIYGKDDTSWVHLSDIAKGRGGFVLRGSEEVRISGQWAALGDFDGDGSDDLAVAATRRDRSWIHLVRGGARYSGVSAELDARVAATGSQVMVTEQSNARPFAVGDLDGDGKAELAIAQPYHGEAQPEAGRVVIVYGHWGSGAMQLSEASTADGVVRIDGAYAFDRIGQAVAGVGDLDGDGFGELAIAAPSVTRFSKERGRVYVVRGGEDPRDLRLADDGLGDRGWILDGGPHQVGFGTSLAPAGDLDGDGHPDILVTSQRFEGVFEAPLFLVFDPRPR